MAEKLNILLFFPVWELEAVLYLDSPKFTVVQSPIEHEVDSYVDRICPGSLEKSPL